MKAVLTTEFWVVFQMILLLLLIAVLVRVIRSMKTAPAVEKNVTEGSDAAGMAAGKVLALLEPVLNEAETAAKIFESQIMEKKILIRDLNEKLDSRIISLNLLLNRADACLASKTFGTSDETSPGAGISDMQEAILVMFEKGLTAQSIAEKLSVARKEVDLVIALKKKFIAMENES